MLRTTLPPTVGYLLYRNWSLRYGPARNADWELVAEQVAKETDSQKLTELAAEFNRLLNKRERLPRQHVTKSG